MRTISKARSKVTPSLHAHPSFQGFFLWPVINKVWIIFGSSDYVNAIFIELSALFLSYADNWGMFFVKGVLHFIPLKMEKV